MKSNHKAHVIIAGAGPGDPDLITYKAIVALRTADVVITDRLVSPVILERFVSSSAKLVYAGKQANHAASASQEDINQMLVDYASQGKLVVRLKGGDVSIFSNLLEELQTLKQNGISYEIIPGITAASGAAAYAGIPLTARSFASSVRFLSFHPQAVFPEKYWKELAQTDDTLVFYMSGERVEQIIEKLTRHGIDPSKGIAVIDQATTPLQHVFVSGLYHYHSVYHSREFVSPSLILIGKVVTLYESFGWLPNIFSTAPYFNQPGTGAAQELLIA